MQSLNHDAPMTYQMYNFEVRGIINVNSYVILYQ